MNKQLIKHLSYKRVFAAIICLSLVCSCGTPRPFYQSGSDSKPDSVQAKKVDQEIFLIGDTGDPVLQGTDYTLQALQYQLEQANDSSAVVFLGDNIYSAGMNPDTTYQAHREDVNIISSQLRKLSNYGGQSFFLPGNHDWRHGVEGIRAQEQYIENFPTADARFVPSNGCPGPEGFELGKNWYLITLDSEWWINKSYSDSVNVEGCEYKTRTDVMNQITELVDENSDKHIVMAFHHPLFSNGNHGGYYPFRDHIFPLTKVVKNLYLPLPLIGSIYPIYRKLGRSGQDLNHQRYEEFAREIRETVDDNQHIFFAAGHEHSLSFYQKEKQREDIEGEDFFILSGAGSKTSYARTGFGAEFVYSHQGFAKLVSYEDGSVNIEFWTPDRENIRGKLVYYKQLIEPEEQRTAAEKITYRRKNYEGTEDTVKTVKAGPNYKAGGIYRFIWGDHYRDAWTTEVEVPVFDLDTKKGGLEVLDVTGGEQTVTIIVQDSSKNKYVMRSVQKNPAESLPDVLQETFVTDVAQDQISALHPFGSVIAPPLAEAAGVYHTRPEVGYLSRKSGVKMEVGEEEEGVLVTFQEFISKEWFNKKYNKQAADIISSADLWERMRQTGQGEVDEIQLVRSRIFDMFIGDWDRHEGQWFWAETRTDSISVYEPIPIDRDNAFFKSDGVIPWLGRREWALRKFQLFDEGIRDMAGMNFNARFFDRWFINELPKKEWMRIAREMQQSITDSVITHAVKQWPEPIQKINGEVFIKKLKKRRDKLTEFASRYYDILSEQVNVYGSDKEDRFEVERKTNGETVVRIYDLSSPGSKNNRVLRYERRFGAEETDEVRLFGFGADDQFFVRGQTETATVIRIVGGEGDDMLDDQSQVAGRSKKTLLYDTFYGSSVVANEGEVQSRRSDDPGINRFDNRAFDYGYTAPLVTAGFNRDDGLFLGGGTLIKTHGFRKDPFAAEHRVTAMHSLLTSSFRFNYRGEFTNEVGPLNLLLKAEFLAPEFVTNYFGLGNETKKEVDDNDFYDYEIDNGDFSIGVSESLENLLFAEAGMGFEYFRPVQTPGTFLTSPQAGLKDDDFDRHYFATASGGFTVSSIDDKLLPHYGIEFNASGELNIGLNDRSESFTRIQSKMKVYHTFERLNTTLASRLGVATNIGDFDFFQANMLGGQGVFTEPGNLRGFLRNRYAGRTSLYHNTELRTELGYLKSYFLPLTVGVSAFFDEGRVWADGESSDKWHYGYGGGIWISPLNYFVISANYAISEEDDYISVTLGFTF